MFLKGTDRVPFMGCGAVSSLTSGLLGSAVVNNKMYNFKLFLKQCAMGFINSKCLTVKSQVCVLKVS